MDKYLSEICPFDWDGLQEFQNFSEWLYEDKCRSGLVGGPVEVSTPEIITPIPKAIYSCFNGIHRAFVIMLTLLRKHGYTSTRLGPKISSNNKLPTTKKPKDCFFNWEGTGEYFLRLSRIIFVDCLELVRFPSYWFQLVRFPSYCPYLIRTTTFFVICKNGWLERDYIQLRMQLRNWMLILRDWINLIIREESTKKNWVLFVFTRTFHTNLV